MPVLLYQQSSSRHDFNLVHEHCIHLLGLGFQSTILHTSFRFRFSKYNTMICSAILLVGGLKNYFRNSGMHAQAIEITPPMHVCQG